MSQLGDLVRSLKAHPQRVDVAAAGKVLAQGNASPAEVQELASLLDSDLGDDFSPTLRESLGRFIQGGGRLQPLPVAQLLPDLERLASLKDVGERVGADFVLLKDQLLPGGKLPKEQAGRLMEFLGAYAERFVALKSGEAKLPKAPPPPEVLSGGLVRPQPGAKPQPLPLAAQAHSASSALRPDQAKEAVRHFTQALRVNGFAELKDARSGRDGLALGSHLLAAPTVADLHRRLAQVRPEVAATSALLQTAAAHHTEPSMRAVQRDLGDSGQLKDRARPELERAGPARLDPMRVQPWQADAGRIVVQAPLVEKRDGKVGAAGEAYSAARKVLGKNMVWNWLHTFREGGGQQEADHKAAMEKLAFAAVVLVMGAALVAILLVTL